MGKFDTHGGYFSPQGYLRINAGGSHDENPNGGVQLGTDPQGIPNMLEENEPVYNDFVYSDNIIASKEMLKKHKLPEKFAGKLFSEIADKFVDEAESRPLDPVSNNGLNAMLVRLADAQEEQKQADEQAALEKEIAKLSPEEQQALMQEIAQQEAAEQAAQIQAVPQEAVQAAPAVVPQEVVAQPQMMACGGKMRKFEDGTPGTVVDVSDGYLAGAMYNPSKQPTLFLYPNTGNYYAAEAQPKTLALPSGEVVVENPDAVDETYYGGSLQPSVAVAFPGRSQAWVDAEVGPRSIKKQVSESRDRFLNNAYDVFNEVKTPLYFVPGVGQAVAATDAVHGVATGNPVEVAFSLPFIPKGIRGAASGAKFSKFDKAVGQAMADALNGETGSAARTAVETATRKLGPKAKKWLIGLGTTAGIGGATSAGFKAYDIWGNAPSNKLNDDYQIDSDLNDFAHGGLIRRFDEAGKIEKGYRTGALVGALMETLPKKTATAIPTVTAVQPTATEDASDTWWFGGDNWKRGQLYGFYLPPDFWNTLGRYDVQPPMRPPEERRLASDVVETAQQSDTPVAVSEKKAVKSSVGTASTATKLKRAAPLQDMRGSEAEAVLTRNNRAVMQAEPKGIIDVRSQATDGSSDKSFIPMLQTASRYAGIGMDAAGLLYNAFQKPTKFSVRPYTPVLNYGNMAFTNPVYNPLDVNASLNDVLASSAGTARQIVNAGQGPSTGALLLANDYNTGKNLGAARATVWDANNQRYNDVVARRNANAQAQAQFQSALGQQRAQAINQAALYNNQNDLMLQRLNDAAESQKYAAISQYTDSMKQALSGIGNENLSLNMLNNTPGRNYDGTLSGMTTFTDRACGGLLKKCKGRK